MAGSAIARSIFLSRRPSNAWPFHLVPLMANATLDRLAIGRPFHGESRQPSPSLPAIVDPMSDQNRAGLSVLSLLVKAVIRADIAGSFSLQPFDRAPA